MDELIYLNNVVKQHGRYLKSYFGFTLREMAEKIGMSSPMFIMIVHGQKKMPEKYLQRFIEVFKEMRIEERTKGFVPSESQKSIRALRAKINLDKLLIIFYIVSMVMWRECISYSNSKSTLNLFNLNLRPIVNCVKQSAIGLFLFINTAINNTMCIKKMSFNLHYEF